MLTVGCNDWRASIYILQNASIKIISNYNLKMRQHGAARIFCRLFRMPAKQTNQYFFINIGPVPCVGKEVVTFLLPAEPVIR